MREAAEQEPILEASHQDRLFHELELEELRDAYQERHCRWLPPKAAQVRAQNLEDGLIPSAEPYYLRGEAMPAIDMPPKRTVFLIRPTVSRGEVRFREVKGYGEEGKLLYPSLHGEGDLLWGMYFEEAEREYQLSKEVRELGITEVQRPLALFEFPEQEFMRHAALGFRYQVEGALGFSDREENDALAVRYGFDDAYKDRSELSAVVARGFYDEYVHHGADAARAFADRRGLGRFADGIGDGKRYGYVVRSVESPYRIGGYTREQLESERTSALVRQVGATVRRMLEAGYWHLTPNPGNWTLAGELVDFEDVCRFPAEYERVERDMEFHEKDNLKEYLEFVYGDRTLWLYGNEFREGFMGAPSSIKNTTATVERILRRLVQDEANE